MRLSPLVLVALGAAAACGTTEHASTAQEAAVIGRGCVPAAEKNPQYLGADVKAIGVETGAPECAADGGTGSVCLSVHFQGRVTCPYGQNGVGAPLSGSSACTVPGSAAPVTGNAAGQQGASVPPQCTDRLARDTVYCSCRCANADGRTDDGSSYCACTRGFSCTQEVASLGSMDKMSGAYCVKDLVAYDASGPCATTCNAASAPCP